MSLEHQGVIGKIQNVKFTPDKEPFRETIQCEVDGNNLRYLLRRVMQPRPRDKYYQDRYSASLVGTNRDRLFFSATSGQTLSYQTLETEKISSDNSSQATLIDGRLLERFIKALTLNEIDRGEDNKIRITFSNKGLFMLSPESKIMARLPWLNGNNDIWAEKIPEFLKDLYFEETAVVVYDTTMLIKGTRKMDSNRMVMIKKSPKDRFLTLEQKDQKIEALSDGKTSLEFFLPLGFFVDKLRNIGSREIAISQARGATSEKQKFVVLGIPNADYFSILMSYNRENFVSP